MTEIIRRSRLAANANSLITNRCKSGISWGTNNYPENSLVGWFAGTNAGPDAAFAANQFDASATDATQAINVLKHVSNLFAGVRRTRIVIYRTHYSLGSTVDSDQTAVAWVNSPVPFSAPVGMSFSNGANMDLNEFNNSCQALYNAYVAACRNSLLTLTNTICHTSCHSNCHAARGRR